MPDRLRESTVDCVQVAIPSGGRVVCYESFDNDALAAGWDRLAGGVPFRSWAWNTHWWRHYGSGPARQDAGAELFILAVFDHSGTLLGIAPWYAGRSAWEGRVVRFLGSGEVCSDYLSVLCAPGTEERVGAALAHWLTRADTSADRGARGRWDLLELTGVAADDVAVARLAAELEARGNTVHYRPGPRCWRIELPASWDAYLASLSKDHRKRVRRSSRGILATDRVTVHSVERLEELAEAQDVLIDLHQRRRQSLGEPGCFASSRFRGFHLNVMGDLLRNGQLRLQWLALDGRPLAAEYALAGDGVIYAYQSGVDPDALDHSPGRLSHVVMLRRAIEQGYRALDFLRGDEPYKPHWRAEPRPSIEVRAVPAKAGAQMRHGLWLAGNRVKDWIRSGLRRTRG